MSADERAPLLATTTTNTSPGPGTPTPRRGGMFWTLGTLYGASVCLGAFGAHGLKKIVTDPAKLASFTTAAHYQVSEPTPKKGSDQGLGFC